ncbi:MAG: PAS domain S-box protein, partial [Anaeromyxobacteraceae bacterium]
QSANEELQTTNEELQSTNEELETTNEELQSTNAELDATNRELAHRTDELNALSFQQRIIIRSISSAVVVIAPNGRILLWNLAAERLLGLTEAEAVGQVLWTLRIAIVTKLLMKQLRKNVDGRVPHHVDEIAYERPGGAVGHVSLALVPLVDDGRGLGAVLLLEDTTRAVVAAEERLREELGTASAPRRRAAKKRRPAAAARRPAAAPRDRSRDET